VVIITLIYRCTECGLETEAAGWTREGREHVFTTIVCRTCGELYEIPVSGLDARAFERRRQEAQEVRSQLKRSPNRFNPLAWLRFYRQFRRKRLLKESQYQPVAMCPRDPSHSAKVWNGLAARRVPEASGNPFHDRWMDRSWPEPDPDTPPPPCPRCEGPIVVVRVEKLGFGR
jgi:DNA-directed RNA polymerase subunit RPC12/RpoP